MKKVLFLDRDGVINRERGTYTYQISDFDILEDNFPFLKKALRQDYQLIIISNQSGIAKGLYGHQQVQKLHHYLIKKMREQDISITDIFYCPHHPSVSKCLCRKPNSLLFEKAIARYNISVENSLLIGDQPRDIEGAEGVGLRTIQIQPNESLLPHTDKL